jgi:hypothetical protein
VVLFSFAAAWGVAWLQRQPPAPERASTLDRRQLFRNYRILNRFLADTPGAAAASDAPLLEAVAGLKRAEELFAARQYAVSAAALARVPAGHAFLDSRRDALHLRLLHANRSYSALIAASDARWPQDLDLRVLRLDGLLRTRQGERAFAEFRPLFARQRLDAFSRHLARPDLAALLRRLGEDDWLAKFAFLKAGNESGEFRREMAYCGFRELNRLFQAEFAYLGRSFGRARQLLRPPLPEPYRAAAECLRLKMDVRDDPGLDLEPRLRALGNEAPLLPGLLFDLAQILAGKGEFARSLPLYERYLGTGGERGNEYWKTVWLTAWIHYRQDDREQALKYFRLGGVSPVAGYRIASRYWQAKLEESGPAELGAYPFSYYAIKSLADQGPLPERQQGFLRGIDAPPGERFLAIVADLQVLVDNGMLDEAVASLRWAKTDPLLGAGDLNLLKVIESLLYYRRQQYFLAYSTFRDNFPRLETVHLPNFLSGLFFPRAFAELIADHSRRQEVDPSLVLALIREESFFRSDVRSPANAIGLMQLLQGTARQVASNSGLKVRARDLYDPEINIRLGLQYLKTLLERYDRRLYLALAAYNAGPHRVDQWLLDYPLADEEEFIEMIPFAETRNYVKNILRNYFFYQYYYEKDSA